MKMKRRLDFSGNATPVVPGETLRVVFSPLRASLMRGKWDVGAVMEEDIQHVRSLFLDAGVRVEARVLTTDGDVKYIPVRWFKDGRRLDTPEEIE